MQLQQQPGLLRRWRVLNEKREQSINLASLNIWQTVPLIAKLDLHSLAGEKPYTACQPAG